MKTIFITGASSGIGKNTVKLFHSKGWRVIAAMRSPEKENELIKFKNIRLLKCDVTDINNIKNAFQIAINEFGSIDVLVNNAGFNTIGNLESAKDSEIKRQLDTNLLGLIQSTKEIIPYFRKQRSGVIINLSSIAGIIAVPLQSLYHATKWGVEGFSESLQYELKQFNIKIKIIEPGVIKTDFYGRSMTITENNNIKEYDSYSEKILKNLQNGGETGSSPLDTAYTIYKAATDNKFKLRYITGNSKEFVYFRKLLPLNFFRFLVRKTMEN